ncbi:hypothetical protein PO124_29575 [Bacillus licheniformis]|nr:hypothetical protein [Bacillus licheniformis]
MVMNISTFIAASILIYQLPYQRNAEAEEHSNTMKMNLTGKLQILTPIFMLSKSFVCSFIDFFYTKHRDYCRKLLGSGFIYDYLNEGPSVIGIANIVYAIGAMGAGFVAYQISKKWSDMQGVILFMAVFALATIAIFLVPNAVTFIVASLFGAFKCCDQSI